MLKSKQGACAKAVDANKAATTVIVRSVGMEEGGESRKKRVAEVGDAADRATGSMRKHRQAPPPEDSASQLRGRPPNEAAAGRRKGRPAAAFRTRGPGLGPRRSGQLTAIRCRRSGASRC